MDIWIVLGVIAFILVIIYSMYAKSIRLRNQVLEALGAIDVQLRKRHDLLPNLLKMAQKYLDHERELMESVTSLRNQAQVTYDRTDPDAVSRHLVLEGQLSQATGRLFNMVAEAYPDMKSHEIVSNAQETFTEVESHIAAARRFYNAAVTDLNNFAQVQPMAAIAAMVGVRPFPYFEESNETVRAPVDVDTYMK